LGRRGAAAAIACALLLGGCGEGSGGGTTATVYAGASLCAGAKRELARRGRVAGVRVRLVCLPAVEGRKGLDLARIGANARRATEDSTSVAYMEEPGPATRFSAPILEEADIAQLKDTSGAASMTAVLRALRRAEEGESLREAVR
jgi:hypothetical protein